MTEKTNKPLVSVVINTYNRLESLKTALSALRYQNYDKFEVIVVNGPSTDSTREYVAKFPEIKYGECPELNLSKSRNIGIAMAAGEYVAFMDDDAIPEPEWLEELVKKHLESGDLASVGGYTKDFTGVNFQAKQVSVDRFGQVCTFAQEKLPLYPHCFQFYYTMGGNCMYHRKRLLSVGGYNEQFDYYLDETETCSRLIDAGYQVDFTPRAYIIHKFSPSPLRDARKISLDWTKIMKNTAYYIYKYEEVCGAEQCERMLNQQIYNRKKELQDNCDTKVITEEEFEQAFRTIDAGVEQGKKDIRRGYDLLITAETLEKFASPFRQFKMFRPADGRVLNIVFFVNVYPPQILGGIGRFVHQMAIGMAKYGHHIHVITPTTLDYDTVDFEDGVWVHRITFKQYPEHLLRRDTCPCEFFMPRMNQLYSYYEELLKIEERSHVDIVQTPIWDSLGFYALLDSRFNTVVSLQSCMKSVFTDSAVMPAEVKYHIRLEQELLTRAKLIMPISNAIMFQLEKYYNLDLKRKSTVVNLGLIDLAQDFVPRKQHDDQLEILFLGRLEHRKGVDVLLKTIPALCKKYPNLLFRFAGDNGILIPGKNVTYEQDFFSLPGNEKYRANTCFEGVVSEERLKQLYAQCDIFVSPSRYESFGLIFLEAMMFSKPVIGCNIGGMPEVIGKHMETGLLAEPDDADSLAQCIEVLIQDPTFRQRIGAAGRRRYEEYFTDGIMVKNTLSYYRSILEKQKGIQPVDEAAL